MKRELLRMAMAAIAMLSARDLFADNGDAAKWGIDTSFIQCGADGMPQGWEKHSFVNYRPFASVLVEDEGTNRILHVFDVNGVSGCGLMPRKRLAVRGGNIVTFKCELKGKGGLCVFLTQYGKNGVLSRPAGPGSQQRVRLTPDWKEETIVLEVQDGEILTESAMVIFEFSHGSEAFVRNLKVDILRTLRSNNYEFSPIWTFLREDFEVPGGLNVEDAKVVSVSHTGGMTVSTKVARFESKDGRKRVVLAGHCPLQGGGKFLVTSFRVFELSEAAKLALRLNTVDGRAAFPLPRKVASMALPVECVFRCGDEGEWSWSCRSLADGGITFDAGENPLFSRKATDLSVELVLYGDVSRVSTALDEFCIGEERASVKTIDLPKMSPPSKTFDPEKAGWRRVFEDNFDGAAGTPYDKAKWFIPDYYNYKDNGRVRHDGKGHLEIVVDYEKGTDRLEAMDLWTNDAWTYGYFEARVRFTRNRGFWAAFWMYSLSHRISTEDGLEIDCFEDGTIRSALEKGKESIDLMHAFHANYESSMKSWGKYSHVPGSLDSFHTVGCLRTPLGVSVYLDGQLAGNTSAGYDQSTPTFDAFRHNLVSTPLHMVLSACVVNSWRGKEHPEVKFPESYLIDWVRAYEMPLNGVPRLSWKGDCGVLEVEEGTKLAFEPRIVSDAAIKEVYLFDDGAYIAKAKEAPWRFDVQFSSDGYRDTRFMSVGNQGVRPDFAYTIHSFTAFAVDEKGRVGIFDGEPRRVLCSAAFKKAPGPPCVQKVPGLVAVGATPKEFVNRAQTGACRVIEIDVAESGCYEATFECFSGSDTNNRLLFAVDGRQVASVSCAGHVDRSWKRDGKRLSCRLNLTKGRHKLACVVIGYLSFGPISLSKEVQ